jgi:hypothetical protein
LFFTAVGGDHAGQLRRIQKRIVSHHIQCFLCITIGVLVSNGAA